MKKKTTIANAAPGGEIWAEGHDALRAILKIRGFTQATFAAKIPGLHQSEVSRFIGGNRPMNAEDRQVFSEVLQCDPDDLKDGAKKLSPSQLMLRKMVRELPEKLEPDAIILLAGLTKK